MFSLLSNSLLALIELISFIGISNTRPPKHSNKNLYINTQLEWS